MYKSLQLAALNIDLMPHDVHADFIKRGFSQTKKFFVVLGVFTVDNKKRIILVNDSDVAVTFDMGEWISIVE